MTQNFLHLLHGFLIWHMAFYHQSQAETAKAARIHAGNGFGISLIELLRLHFRCIFQEKSNIYIPLLSML